MAGHCAYSSATPHAAAETVIENRYLRLPVPAMLSAEATAALVEVEMLGEMTGLVP